MLAALLHPRAATAVVVAALLLILVVALVLVGAEVTTVLGGITYTGGT